MIALSGHQYATALDEDGFPIVLRFVRAGMWRVADPVVSLRIIAGLITPPIRNPNKMRN